MGSSYTKQKQESNIEECREIPFGDGSMEFCRSSLQTFMEQIDRIDDLEQELILLKKTPTPQKPTS